MTFLLFIFKTSSAPLEFSTPVTVVWEEHWSPKSSLAVQETAADLDHTGHRILLFANPARWALALLEQVLDLAVYLSCVKCMNNHVLL